MIAVNLFIFNFNLLIIKKFIINIIVIILVVLFLDVSLGKILEYLYFKQKVGVCYRTTYSLNQSYEDILIFGASSANHHYDPDIFETSFNMKYYNAGRDGCSIFYHYAILRGVLKRYNPKLIIYDFSSEEFNYNNKSYEVLSSLLPYCKSNLEVRDIVLMRGKFEKLKLISNIYPYNSLIISILGGNIGNSVVIDDKQGYIPLNKVWNEPLGTFNNAGSDSIDNNKIIYSKNFVEDCMNRGIKIVVIRSPRFRKDITQSKSLYIAKEICSDFKIKYFDFSYDTLFLNHSNYFQDISHLNDSGAKIFSKKVVDKLISEQLFSTNN